MAKAGRTGVSANTPQNIVFGAGTIHKNLKYTDSAWNLDESIIGATKDGSSLAIVPEFYEVEPDGAAVSVKELTVKVGETATLTVNFLELTKELIKAAVVGNDGTSEDSNYDLIESKADLVAADYWENVAFVGRTLGGKQIIVVLENPIVTSGLNLEGANKEAGTVEYEFKCHADLSGDLDKLPYKIYYPKA